MFGSFVASLLCPFTHGCFSSGGVGHNSKIGVESVRLPFEPEPSAGVVDAGASVSTVGADAGAGTGAGVGAGSGASVTTVGAGVGAGASVAARSRDQNGVYWQDHQIGAYWQDYLGGQRANAPGDSCFILRWPSLSPMGAGTKAAENNVGEHVW